MEPLLSYVERVAELRTVRIWVQLGQPLSLRVDNFWRSSITK